MPQSNIISSSTRRLFIVVFTVAVASALLASQNDSKELGFLRLPVLTLCCLAAFLAGSVIGSTKERLARLILFGYSFVLIGGTLIYAMYSYINYEGTRVDIFFGNPTLLGSAIALAAIPVWDMRSRYTKYFLIAGAIGALAFTGARVATAALALALGLLASAHGMLGRSRVRRVLAITLALLAVPITVVQFVRIEAPSGIEDSRNLLQFSDRLTHAVWSTGFGHNVVIEAVDSVTPPGPGGAVHRLTARPNINGRGDGLLLRQSLTLSSSDEPYIASVFVKAPTSTSVILATPFARATCEVRTYWTRCATPPSAGDGDRPIQF